jgi:hypothetical protein
MSFPALVMMMTRREFGPARTRFLSSLPSNPLLERLSGQMGPESAELELKWMREEVRARGATTSSPSHKRDELGWELGELRKMVERRMEGEPLQYILGGYGSKPCPIAWALPGIGFCL